MDDAVIFAAFLEKVCGLAVSRARTEVLTLVDTFRALLTTTDDEIDAFVKSTHSSNSARAAQARILIPSGAVLALKAVLFELKDREKCNALPNPQILAALDAQQVTLMRAQRTTSIEEAANALNLPQMEVPKLTATNYEEFFTQ